MMKRVILIIILCFLSGAIACGVGWFLRAEYDKMFMLRGWFHVINTSNEELGVLLRFPSGYEMELQLSATGSKDFVLQNTGEGAISVTVNQRDLGSTGYMTSMNGMVVLTIDHESVGFSQIFPSLKPERSAAAYVRPRAAEP